MFWHIGLVEISTFNDSESVYKNTGNLVEEKESEMRTFFLYVNPSVFLHIITEFPL